jgi:hypothetical protein
LSAKNDLTLPFPILYNKGKSGEMMKITTTILSIPPYLSTTWKNISSLHVKQIGTSNTLIVILQNRVQVEVPHLDAAAIDEIFEAHARASEESSPKNPLSPNLPIRPEETMQHNPEQANMPPLPPEILNKLGAVARALGFEDTSILPQAEPHCNCVYCQVVRSLHPEAPVEDVLNEELTFRDWEIKQSGEKLYEVTNPLDQNEKYNVFLGTPIGCTCGEKNCEHIRSVLNS